MKQPTDEEGYLFWNLTTEAALTSVNNSSNGLATLDATARKKRLLRF
jgi:hypothetical protein